MKLVVGLGNPGLRYHGTRHNVGFMVADLLLERSDAPSGYRGSFQGRTARVRFGTAEAVLLKPETFMNRSGRSVREAVDFYRIEPDDIVVVHDDLDLDLGVVRVKRGGGSGGHRGLESCFAELGSRELDRVRVGIGRPGQDRTATDHVLQGFEVDERGVLDEVLGLAADAALTTVTAGASAAMNRYNRRAANGGEG